MQTSVFVYTRNHKVTLRRMASTDIISLLCRDLLAHIDNSLTVIGLERDQAWNMMSLPLTTFNPKVLTPPSSPFLPPFPLWSDCMCHINNFALPLLHYLTTNCPGDPWDSGGLTPTSAVMVWILIRALLRSIILHCINTSIYILTAATTVKDMFMLCFNVCLFHLN